MSEPATWLGVLALLVALLYAGCGPHYKHYRSRGQASHYPNCRAKCAARTAWDWHERRR